jgi:hypothetical protein
MISAGFSEMLSQGSKGECANIQRRSIIYHIASRLQPPEKLKAGAEGHCLAYLKVGNEGDHKPRGCCNNFYMAAKGYLYRMQSRIRRATLAQKLSQKLARHKLCCIEDSRVRSLQSLTQASSAPAAQ